MFKNNQTDFSLIILMAIAGLFILTTPAIAVLEEKTIHPELIPTLLNQSPEDQSKDETVYLLHRIYRDSQPKDFQFLEDNLKDVQEYFFKAIERHRQLYKQKELLSEKTDDEIKMQEFEKMLKQNPILVHQKKKLFEAELAQKYGPCLKTMGFTETLQQLRNTLAAEYQQELDPLISKLDCNSDETAAKKVEEKVIKLLDRVESDITSIRNKIESQKSQTAF